MAQSYEQPVIIAGTGPSAEVIAGFIEGDGLGSVAGFTVDGDHIQHSTFLDKPLVAIGNLPEVFPIDKYCVVNAIGYNHMNETRRRISDVLWRIGYRLPGFIHPSAMIDRSVKFGKNLVAVQGVIIEPYAVIGDNVTLWAGAYVGHHSTIGENVYVGPRAVVAGTVTIDENAFIGANAIIRSKVRVGARCLVGAGCYVNRNLSPKTVLKAVPSVESTRSSDDFGYFA